MVKVMRIKTKLYECISILICLFTMFTQATPIFAENNISLELPYGMTSGKWSVQLTQYGNWGGNEDYYAKTYINGQHVYCTEPLVNIIPGSSYNAMDLPSFVGSNSLAHQLEYISALGYGFNGDYSQEMDFATQIRIWQEINPGLVYSPSIHPDIQAKINEINARLHVMNHNVSFHKQSVILKGYGKEFAQTVKDEKGNFAYYHDYSTTGIHSSRDGNSLTIWAEKGDSKNVDLIYDCLYFRNQAGTSIAYQSGYSQNVAYLQGADPRACVLNVQVQTGSIQFSKQDIDTIRAQGDASLANATFDLIDSTTNQIVGTLLSDVDGKTNRIDDLPTDRTYILHETGAPEGYLNADDKIVDFSIIEANENNDKVYAEAFQDNVITGKIQLEKVITNGKESEIVKPEKDAEFVVMLKKYVEKYGDIDSALAHTDEMSNKEWNILTTDENGKAISSDLAYGSYIVKQTKGQEETKLLKDAFEVNIQNQGEILSYTINNVPTRYYVKLVKVDQDTKEKITLSSASFKVKDSKGKYVTMKVGNKTYDTFTTTSQNGIGILSKITGDVYTDDNNEQGEVILPLTLEAGTYTLEEIETPEGFIRSKPIEFKISKDYVHSSEEDIPTIEITVENKQPKGKVLIQKSVKSKKFDASDIEFTLFVKDDIQSKINGSILYHKNDTVGVYKTDDKGKIEISDLVLGHYVLKETKTKDGLVLDENEYDIDLVQKDDVQLEYLIQFDIENKPTRTSFTKTDVTGQEELEGASLTIYDDQHEIVETWTSSKKAHVIEGLIVGKKYILEETIAIDGYVKASNIEFEVLNTSEVQHVQMMDKYVDVSKVDLASNEVEGALMQVLDEQKEIIDEWTSTKEIHKISNLEEGKKYTLHEDLSPAGYELANDIEFTVEMTKENQHITMIDKKLDKVSITKYDATSKKELPGAKLKVTDKNGKVIDEWISTTEAHVIENLYVNETYTLTEIQAPDQYAIASSIDFTIEDNGKVVQKVAMFDELKSVVRTRVITHHILFGVLCSASLLGIIVCILQMKKKND